MYRWSFILKCLVTTGAVTFLLYQYLAIVENSDHDTVDLIQERKQNQQNLRSDQSQLMLKHKERNNLPSKTNRKQWPPKLKTKNRNSEEIKLKAQNNKTKGENSKAAGHLQVVFRSLEGCQKPDYLPEYKALCYKNG